MVLHILGQQISIPVAYILFDRLADAAGGIPTAEAVTGLGPEELRALGMTRAKAAYLLDLSSRVTNGTLDIENLDRHSDDEAVAALIAVKGVGLWSAQMFLIHQLHRPDILPAGDIGIRRAIANAWSLAEVPTIAAVTARGSAWAPYRTCAAAVLWQSLAYAEKLAAHPVPTAPGAA